MNDEYLRRQRNTRSGLRTGWALFGAGLALAAEKALMLASGMGRTPFPWALIVAAVVVGIWMALANERGGR